MVRYLVIDDISKEIMGIYTDPVVANKVAKKNESFYVLKEKV
jgi:hypothetical protein